MVEFQGMIGKAGESFDGISIDIDNPVSISGKYRHSRCFTHIPISSLEFRKEHKIKAKCEIQRLKDKTLFHLYSDRGDCYDYLIDNDDPVLNKVIDNLTEQGLLIK